MRILLCLLVLSNASALSLHDYHQQRQHIKLQRRGYGSELPLSSDELRADEILLKWKEEEILEGIRTQLFPPSRSFFESKELIEKSKVFQMIKMMPKGAALHLHDLAMVDPQWIVQNLTYRDECWVCSQGKEILAFRFSHARPGRRDGCSWVRTSEARAGRSDEFDDLILYHLTIEPANRYVCQVDQNLIWQRAERAFTLLGDLLFVQPNLALFWSQALTEFRNDGALFVEPRSLVFPTQDATGKTYDEEYYIQTYKQVNDLFVQNNPDFIGSKIIKCDIKFLSVDQVRRSLDLVMRLRDKYPDYLAGYDLVGQEDKSQPLEQYLDALLAPGQMAPPVHIPYFFHAGETDWYDTAIDWNLLDAIMLNSSRIGHAYSLVKHPDLVRLVKVKDVAVEVNPISNQVLGLVSDLRNHPVTYLMARNVSVVVSSDDPGIWRSLPLSHDYYSVFMANTGLGDGLRTLKRLTLNSIQYSSMDERQRARAYTVFNKQWAAFIRRVINEFA